jgi:hypothetical protein
VAYSFLKDKEAMASSDSSFSIVASIAIAIIAFASSSKDSLYSETMVVFRRMVKEARLLSAMGSSLGSINSSASVSTVVVPAEESSSIAVFAQVGYLNYQSDCLWITGPYLANYLDLRD